MVRALVCALLLIVMGWAAVAQLPAEQEQTAVLRVVTQLFEAMQKQDVTALRALFLADGRLLSTYLRNGQPVTRSLTLDAFAQMVAETKEPYRERMLDTEVRIQGDLATVWGRYDFHVGERLTNCGTNAFQLLRTAEGWKIASIASTIVTEGCQPKGKP